MKGKIVAKILNSNFTKKLVKGVVKNAPKILTGLSIASSVAAVGFAIKGTVLAVEIEKRRKAKIESGKIPKPEHPKLETVKSVWKCYIPAVTFLTASIGTSLYGTSISTIRTAMANSACKASELAFEEYKAKVIEQIGEEKEAQIRQEIVKEHVSQRETSQMQTVPPFEKYLCKERYTGAMFYSNLYEIKEEFLRMNYDLIHCGSDELSLMMYLDHFNIDSHEEELGWNLGTTGLLDLSYCMETDDYGRPVLSFGPTQRPYENYNIYG